MNHGVYRVLQKSSSPDIFCDNFRKFTPILTTFNCYNKKGMTHKSKITPATSPVLCNHPSDPT